MMLRRAVLTATLVAAVTGVVTVPAGAAPPPGAAANQFYYTVTSSYQGAPENLWEISARFLGDAGRAGEILDLNAGRVQPDGGRLSDPSRLRAGWHLVLPWDAVGTGLRHGPLPTADGKSSACPREEAVAATAAWGQTLLAPNRAWPEADGSGVRVAVIGSGVDGSAPELAGRVSTGTDVAAGTGRADTGCEGAGTALAGIVAGDDGADGRNFGVAPAARIVPIRAGTGARTAATAVDVATGSGAQVVLIDAGVDATDPAIRAAVSDAIGRNVVVVVPATAGVAPMDGLLRVGALGADRQPAGNQPDDAVDLLAPGVDVASIGRTGTGAEYAAAFVAGTVALVRSAHPTLHAADVTRQVRDTAAQRLVDPVAAVTTPLPGGVGVNAEVETPSSGLGTLSRVLTWVAVGLAVVVLLAYLLPPPVRALGAAVARRRARRQALAARARITDDDGDDPFWDRPAGQPAHDRASGVGGATR
ncbi:S8 family serine peptidase [Micromonospora sp. NPDC049051]|uniref:S8 family serine peptidase n=1 Tax=Micromonospora sp. NPDC049051 TaxID=3364264 RepID=UPI003710804E